MQIKNKLYDQLEDAYEKMAKIDRELEAMNYLEFDELENKLDEHEQSFQGLMELLGKIFSGGA